MFCNSNQVLSSNENSTKLCDKTEKLLNLKIYYLNNSSSKFVGVGIALSDFEPKIVFGGQNGFSVILDEEEWDSFKKNEGLLANYFYSFSADLDAPLKIGNVTICFEKIMNSPVVKILKHEKYVFLGKESIDKLLEVKEILDYRIQMVKKQEFQKYFTVFQHHGYQFGNIFETIYQTLNPSQNPNSENVSTMLELVMLHPNELQSKLKKVLKRKYYEISDN